MYKYTLFIKITKELQNEESFMLQLLSFTRDYPYFYLTFPWKYLTSTIFWNKVQNN